MVTDPIFADMIYVSLGVFTGALLYRFMKYKYMQNKYRLRRIAELAQERNKTWAKPSEVHYGSNGQLYQIFPDPITGEEKREMDTIINEREMTLHEPSAWSDCPRCEMHALHWYADAPLTQEEWDSAEISRKLHTVGGVSFADSQAKVQKNDPNTGQPIGEPIVMPVRLAGFPINRECINCKYVWGQNA